jgi:hypothetical protein
MATSGSTDYAATRDDIITEALELLGVLPEGESPSVAELTACSRTLNYMVKSWQGKFTNLWTRQKAYVFLAKDQSEYTLSSTGDHWTNSFVSTQVNGAHSASDTTIEVDSITGFSASDNIGIELADGTMHWDVINGAPSGSTITLTTGIASAAADNAWVYGYTTKGSKPRNILHAHLSKNPSTDLDIPIFQMSLGDYQDLPHKASDGTVNQFNFQRKRDTGVLSVWPQTSNVTDYLTLYVQRSIEDFDAATDDSDFPQEWFQALATNLALRLSSKYGVSGATYTQVKENAILSLWEVESDDTEEGIEIQPDGRRS